MISSLQTPLDFTPPPKVPLFSSNTFIFWVLNVLTAGIYGAAEQVSKQHRIRELKIKQDDLQDKVNRLIEDWSSLEQDMGVLLDTFEKMSVDLIDPVTKTNQLKKGLTILSSQNAMLNAREVSVQYHISASKAQVALGAIEFLGHVLANILTLGLYGVKKNYDLKNRIKLLEEQNEFLIRQYNALKIDKFTYFQKTTTLVDKNLTLQDDLQALREENQIIRTTDPGKAYAEAENARQDVIDLLANQTKLKQEIIALHTQMTILKSELAQKSAEISKEAKNYKELRGKYVNLKKAKRDADEELDDKIALVNKNEILIATLRTKLHEAKEKSAKIQLLEEKISRLSNQLKHQPGMPQLHAEVIPPLYRQRQDDPKEILGAIDLDRIKKQYETRCEESEEGEIIVQGEMSPQEEKRIKFLEEYQLRYGNKDLASEIMESSFEYAFTMLYEMAEGARIAATAADFKKEEEGIQELAKTEGAKAEERKKLLDERKAEEEKKNALIKIKINKSSQTGYKPCASAVYNLMALKLLEGARLEQNCKEQFEVKINDTVIMLPSMPARVIESIDEQNSGYESVVIHKQRDEFTPPLEIIGNSGVDPVGAKWILERLTVEEKDHLFNLLASAVIENNHPEYSKTLEFLKNDNDRVQLVRTALELIRNMGFAFQKKFERTVFAKCWLKFTDDFELEPFYKQEDVTPFDKDIPDTALIQTPKNPETVPFKLDMEIFWEYGKVEEFWQLVRDSRETYRTIFEHLKTGAKKERDDKVAELKALMEPFKNDFYHSVVKGENPLWEEITKQYYVSHLMLGNQHCLFSNLLASITTRKADLTVDNVRKLKNSMANYLDKLQLAKEAWEKAESDLPKDDDGNIRIGRFTANPTELKRMADLANDFEKGIKSFHAGCSVEEYKGWLREEEALKSKIDIRRLSIFDLQLFAHTMGIKVGLLSITSDSKINIDEYGRIVPEKDYFGPNTREFLLMAIITQDNQGTFYALHPKLTIPVDPEFPYAQKTVLENMNRYWESNNFSFNRD